MTAPPVTSLPYVLVLFLCSRARLICGAGGLVLCEIVVQPQFLLRAPSILSCETPLTGATSSLIVSLSPFPVAHSTYAGALHVPT